MKKILILGAGRSSSVLIEYLLSNAKKYSWFITIADYSLDLAKIALHKSSYGKAVDFDVENEGHRRELISESDIVVSMLPAHMHIIVAKDCIRYKKNMVTASYVSEDMSDLDLEAKKSDVLILNEVGLDPGLDHMSAMKIIDRIRHQGGKVISFKSFCGGLIHPDSDNNPWNYKFTWNPRNVVLAGQGTAQYIKAGKYKYIPYHKLFDRIENMNILDAGEFEGYPNRDSLIYKNSYGLEEIDTILRGTLRRKGFCRSWNIFVKLGMTDDSYILYDMENMTYREFTNLFLPYSSASSLEEKFCLYLGISQDSDIFKKVEWLGIFGDEKIKLNNVTPAKVLQSILEDKWSLGSNDRDMVVMHHDFEYRLSGVLRKKQSSLLVFGENQRNTAMAKTVGLPVAIAVKLILQGDVKEKGVCIPVFKNIYEKILSELESYGVRFIDEDS